MGYRTGHVGLYKIRTSNLDEDLIKMWSDLDLDYSEESEQFDEEEYEGYSCMAEKEIKTFDWSEHSTELKIENVLDWIEDFHGSYSIQFKYLIKKEEDNYWVAVSFIS